MGRYIGGMRACGGQCGYLLQDPRSSGTWMVRVSDWVSGKGGGGNQQVEALVQLKLPVMPLRMAKRRTLRSCWGKRSGIVGGKRKGGVGYMLPGFPAPRPASNGGLVRKRYTRRYTKRYTKRYTTRARRCVTRTTSDWSYVCMAYTEHYGANQIPEDFLDISCHPRSE